MALSRGGCEIAEPSNFIPKVRDSLKNCGLSLFRIVRSFGDLKRVIVIYALCMGVGYMMWMSLLVLDMVAGSSCLSDAVVGLTEEPNQFQFLFVSIQFTNGMLGLLLGFSLLTHPPAHAFFFRLTRYCLRRWKIRGLPKVKYASLKKTEHTESCCICLGRIGDEDSVCILPNCKHYFHRRCVDRWLLCGNNCPICRATVCDES